MQNLTSEEFSEILHIRYHESNTQYWPKPERTYEKVENFEVRPHFLTFEAENKTMKKFLRISREKDSTEAEIDNNSFIHTKLHFFPNILMEVMKVKSD